MKLRREAPAGYPHPYGILLMLGVYLALAVAYSLVVPPFESPDELHHMGYVVHLVREGALPIQRPGETTLFAQEGSQPPLYYLMASFLVHGVDVSDFSEVSQLNPYVRMGLPSAIDNQHLVMHPPTGSALRDSILALHLVRWLSIAMGIGTILSTYALVRSLFPNRSELALATAATTAFTPMFVFLSSSANNDNLIILLSSVTLLTLVRTGNRGTTPTRLAGLGVLCGAALLSKLSGIALLALVLAALLAFAVRDSAGLPARPTPTELLGAVKPRHLARALQRWLGHALWVLGPVLVIAGWWYLRNLRLYGEPTGVDTMLAIFGRRKVRSSFGALLGEFRGFCMSYWGIFGIFNVLIRPSVVYPLLLGIGVLGMLGSTWALIMAWRQKRRLPWLAIGVFGLWPLALGASLIRWTSMTYASQGRLVFPAISALSLAFVGGLAVWFGPRHRRAAYLGLPVLLLATTLAQPWASIGPAYAAPQPLRPDEIPSAAQPIHARFGPVELVAVHVDREQVEPGGRFLATLYWQTHEAVDEDLTLFIHVFGRDGAKIAQRDSFHGGGTYPTSYWRPGQIVHGTYAVDVAQDAVGPTAAEIVVGLYDRHTMVPITAADLEGNPVGKLTVSRIKITGETTPATPQWPAEALFGSAIALRGYDLDWASWDGTTPLPITLHWEALSSIDRDWTVFVHLVDAQNRIVGQGDGPPCDGEYPTSFWKAGEWLQDEHLITLNEDGDALSDRRILVGLYDPKTGERLPVTDANGSPLGDHVVIPPSIW
ncbi:MAG: glycosyltransferase family 39 protein [Anaerolineae bacterium]